MVISGQTDSTGRTVSEFAERDSRVRLYEEPGRRGKASAVNLVLSKARGEVIIFVTADGMPEEGCLSGLLQEIRDNTVGIACGKPIPVKRGGLLMRMIVDTQ